MYTMFSVFVFIFVSSLSDVFASTPPAVLILSFDNFHPQDHDEDKTPFLTTLYDKAAGPSNIAAFFPGKHFVTHFTISTGVNPDVHGVYNDEMFDKDGHVISNTKEQFQSNPNIVPIWIENQKAAEDRHSGVMMWPGSKFEYQNLTPTYYQDDKPDIDWNKSVDTIVDWMTKPDKRANLVMAYFEKTQKTDKATHQDDLYAHLKVVDDTIKSIYSKLKNANIGEFNMVLLSDHGTTEVPYSNIIDVEENMFTSKENVVTIVSGPLVFVKVVNPDNYSNEFKKLKSHGFADLNFFVYEYKDHPRHWSLKIPILEQVIILVAKKGYTFYEKEKKDKLLPTNAKDQSNYVMDEFGYDTDNLNMNGFLLGVGPKFKPNTFPTYNFPLVNVHQIFKKLLDLPQEEITDQDFISEIMQN